MIPKGFVEVSPVQHPPLIAADHLVHGAVVKYVQSRLVETALPNGESTVSVVHEFTSRAGSGLLFRLPGSPDLNGKLWACRPSWVLWLQSMESAGQLWHVGAVLEVRVLSQLLAKMESEHRELDHLIAIESGMLRAGKLRFLAAEDDAVRELVRQPTLARPG